MEILSRREASYDKIASQMRLRTPQLEALEKFHAIVSSLPSELGNCSQSEVNAAFKSSFPSWNTSDDGLLNFTINLATGVGKTRLIGAIIAYLFNSGDAKNFLIVTPRSEIIRKFIRELQPESPKYIFHDPSLIARANIISLGTITRSVKQISLWDFPNVWVLSPQAFSAKGARIKSGGDDGLPTFDFIRNLNDLTIFFDESHHLGNENAEQGAWKSELEALLPKFLIGTTASLVGQSNILYSYPLKKCLDEKLYTKSVQIIADKVDQDVTPAEQDHIALRFALERIDAKETALKDYAVAQGLESTVSPVLLVNCKDIDHAKNVSDWLKEVVDDEDAVLLIHNELKPDDYLPKLMELEQQDNKIRVVVQVAMLNEGWDVSNVYVICPLRQMNSITLVEQVMGRGLRLPFGHRTQVPMIDELDVVCFGRQTVQDLANEAINAGYADSSISVVKKEKATKPQPTIEYMLEHKKQPEAPLELIFPRVKRKQPEIDLGAVNLPPPTSSDLHGFDISDPQSVKRIAEIPKLPLEEFASATASSVIKNCKFLSASKDRPKVDGLVSRLVGGNADEKGQVSLSPESCAAFIKSHLDAIYRGIRPTYEATKLTDRVDLLDVSTRVAKPGNSLAEATIGSRSDWLSKNAANLPINGWKRCIYEAVPFDVYHELTVARCIDRCPDIGWWFRNLPGMIVLDTPAGRYSPDFAAFVELEDSHVLLEVKGDVYAGSTSSDASIKKRAAELWCKAVSPSCDKPWEYWFLLDSDAARCNSWADIVKFSDKG